MFAVVLVKRRKMKVTYSMIEQHFDVQDESLNCDHPDVQTDDRQNAIETLRSVDRAQVMT